MHEAMTFAQGTFGLALFVAFLMAVVVALVARQNSDPSVGMFGFVLRFCRTVAFYVAAAMGVGALVALAVTEGEMVPYITLAGTVAAVLTALSAICQILIVVLDQKKSS